MKQTLNTFSHKTLAFTILAASLSLPAFANAADVSTGVNASASANLNADAAASTVAQSVKHAKHAKHHLVKKATVVKEKTSETVSNGAAKVKSSAQTSAEKVRTSVHTSAEAVDSGAASVSTGVKAMIAPVTTSVITPVSTVVAPIVHSAAPAANGNASTNSSTHLGIQTPVGSIGGAVHVGAGIR